MGYREDIVQYCKDNIGCDYDWTPSGGVEGESYNCSFLSTCAYAAAGLDIPSWQGHQNGNGSQTDWVRWAGHWTDDPDELLPGDLVFFGSSPYNTGHVGISLGGEDMIDSIPDGGVQHRELYWNFVGGGWPFDWTPEEKEEEKRKAKEMVEMGMTCIISIKNRNTLVWFDGVNINDLDSMEEVHVLQKIFKECNKKDMPGIELSEVEFAYLCQAIKGSFPAHLSDLVNKYKNRSPEK